MVPTEIGIFDTGLFGYRTCSDLRNKRTRQPIRTDNGTGDLLYSLGSNMGLPLRNFICTIHRGRQALFWGRQVSISTSSLLFTGHFDKPWLLIEAKSRTANAAGSMLGSLDAGLPKYAPLF
jgi:hypothetical protein